MRLDTAELVALQRSAAMLTPGQSMPIERDVLFELCGEVLEARQLLARLGDGSQGGGGEGSGAQLGRVWRRELARRSASAIPSAARPTRLRRGSRWDCPAATTAAAAGDELVSGLGLEGGRSGGGRA